MSEPAALSLNGADLLADLSGALIWPPRRLLAVADLHLEKGSGFAARGQLLPPYDTAQTLARLADAIERHEPESVICLGDSFHDGRAAQRLGRADGERLAGLIRGRRWIWIAGNHDPAPPAERSLGMEMARDFAGRGRGRGDMTEEQGAEDELRLHHAAEIGRRVGGRCFIGDERRLILPAFGAYAGGLDVRDPAIAGLFGGRTRIHILGQRRLHSFAAGQLAYLPSM